MATRVYGTTFIVTSTADSGPGTLREAILNAAANGTAVTDYITFNINQTVFNQRFINLVTPLPPLSSNLVIDGTTQPGEKFAITDASICIRKMDYAASFTLFTISGVSDVKIYGLYLFYGYWQGVFDNTRSKDLYAIKLSNARNIEIGAPGKGNVINGYEYAIYSLSDSCRNVRIQSNYIGQGQYYLDYTLDVDENIVPTEAAIEMLNVKDVLIGGPNANEGNLITANRAMHLDSRYATDNGFIHIENNVFGKYYDRTRILGGQDANIPNLFIGDHSFAYFGPSPRPAMDYTVRILNNDIPTSLGISDLSEKFFVKGNHFEIPSNSAAFTNMGAKLLINDCADGEVGGPALGDSNVFRNGGVYGLIAISAYFNRAVSISQNVFECNTTLGGSPTLIFTDKTTEPFVRIDATSPTQVSGAATPDCTIEIFYDDDCEGCEGKVFVGRTTSDASGNWTYSGTIARPVVATATTGIGTTGEFSIPETDISNVVVRQPSCGQQNGSITGLIIRGGDGGSWRDVNGNVVSNTIDLENVGPGRYIFYAKLGNTCMQFGAFYELIENTARIADTTAKIIVDPTCGRNNGSISNVSIVLSSNVVVEWQNDRGQVIPAEINGMSVSARDLYPGRYRLYIRDTTGGGCNDSTFFYQLSNTFGPMVDTNGIKITPASCGESNGSITNLSLSRLNNLPFLQWVDSLNRPVSNTLDLLDQPAGKYRLKFKENSGCDTIYTVFFTIPVGDLSLDSSQILITSSRCAQNNGSIKGIKVPAATGYSWIDVATGNVVGTSADLLNVGAGTYRLKAFNNTGCTVQSNLYTVTAAAPMPAIDAAALQIIPDTCERGVGAITGINFTNASDATYKWFDDSNQQVGQQKDLRNISEGVYYLEMTDGNQCKVTSPAYTVNNLSAQLAAPVYDSYTVPKGIPYSIQPTSARNGTYTIYDVPSGGVPIDQNSTGVFHMPALDQNFTYYIEIREGNCTSLRVPVSIKIVDETLVSVPNAFSPNGDGHHETWGIKVTGILNLSYLRVFNRWGQVIFETKDPSRRWDGTLNGNPLPIGTYYWILQGSDAYGKPINMKGPVLIVR